MQIEGSLEAWVEGQTVTRWLRDGVRERGDRVALRARGAEGAWQDVTWAQVGDGAAGVAGGLQRLGVGAGDTVLLMLRNRPEFHIADPGALLLRAIPVSIYNTSAPEQIAYLASHCGAKVAIVDDLGFLARILQVRHELPGLEPYLVALLVLDPDRTPAWAELNGIAGKALAELAEDPAVLAEIDRGVAAANEHLNHAEQVKKWAVIGEECLPDSPQLTATMKLKRRGVLRAYGPLIDDLYGEASPPLD